MICIGGPMNGQFYDIDSENLFMVSDDAFHCYVKEGIKILGMRTYVYVWQNDSLSANDVAREWLSLHGWEVV